MIVRTGESQRLDITSGKIGGITIYINATASAINHEIVPGDINTALFQCITTLSRGGKQYVIHNDNLKNLGTYYMRKNAYERFLNGLDVLWTTGADGNTNQKYLVADIMFRSPIHLGTGDKLSMQFTNNTGMFGANINTAVSYVDFLPVPSTGYEFGIPMFQSLVIQTNAQSQNGVNAENVKHVEFINYDQTNITNQVLTNIALGSDKVQYSATFPELLAADQRKYPNNKPYRFSTASLTAPVGVSMALDWLPQSVSIFDADGTSLNACVVNLNFNPANVNASQNWLMWDMLYVDPAHAAKSIQRMANQFKANIANIAAGSGS
jgi:hypothetical protein